MHAFLQSHFAEPMKRMTLGLFGCYVDIVIHRSVGDPSTLGRGYEISIHAWRE